jgi:hypothetical protein
MRGCDDLVAGPDVERSHCQIQCIGAVGARHAMLDLDSFGEFALESFDIGTANERVVADDGFDGAVDFAFDASVLQLQVGKRDRHLTLVTREGAPDCPHRCQLR